MSERRNTQTADEIRGLIERIEGQLRQSEQLRSYAEDRAHRTPIWPERRRAPRLAGQGSDASPSEKTG